MEIATFCKRIFRFDNFGCAVVRVKTASKATCTDVTRILAAIVATALCVTAKSVVGAVAFFAPETAVVATVRSTAAVTGALFTALTAIV